MVRKSKDEELILEEAEEEKPKEEPKEDKPKPKSRKPRLKGEIFVLTNEGIRIRFDNLSMRRATEVADNVRFEVTDVGSSGKLSYDIALSMVKRGGYLLIEEKWLNQFGVPASRVEMIDKGIAYIKK